MPQFTWFPVASHEKSVEPKVAEAVFGDGYAQRVKDGINSVRPVWSLKFEGTPAEIDPIDAFLNARGGAESFDWRTPESEDGKYICKKWAKQRERGVKVTLSAEFEWVPL